MADVITENGVKGAAVLNAGVDAPGAAEGADGADGTAESPGERIAVLERELSGARRELESLTRRARIERALYGAGAMDARAVAAQVESALGVKGAADDAAVADQVARLRERRPGLFRATSAGALGGAALPGRAVGSSVMGALAAPASTDPRGELASRARAGDRGSLLTYLRARRAAG